MAAKQLSPGDPAPDVSLVDHEGHTVRLAELWQQRPLALVFLRHLG